jgi:glycerol-3-phosphate dehydrogenase
MQAIRAADPTSARPLVEDLPVSGDQIVYAARHEMALHLSDAVLRRQPLYLSAHLDLKTLQRAAQWMAPALHWSPEEARAEAEATLQELHDFQGRSAHLP